MVEELKLRHWGAIALLALLWHLFLLFLPWDRWIAAPQLAPPPKIEVQQIDPAKLEAIRQQWRKEKSLLLSKDTATAATPPKDARYLSDRNRTVEKEQRARQTQVIPKAGKAAQEAEKAQNQKAQKQRSQMAPSLSQLGVPLNPANRYRDMMPTPPQQEAEEGGDQALLEKNLAEGDQNILNTQESIYYSFYARLYQAIAPIWQSRIREVPYSRRVAEGEYTTQVEVLMDRSGQLVEVKFHRNSGIPEFDRAVESSWKRIGKFPNPPVALIEADGYVHTGWTFSVDVGEGFNAPPPSRNF